MAKNIEMQYYSGSAYEICYPKTLSTQVIMADSTTLEATITSLKTSVSEGKSAIASAITNKGVSTASTATFSTMATNIGKISTLSTDTSDATATAARILNGYTAYVKGSKVTGTLVQNTAQVKWGTFNYTNSSAPSTLTFPCGFKPTYVIVACVGTTNVGASQTPGYWDGFSAAYSSANSVNRGGVFNSNRVPQGYSNPITVTSTGFIYKGYSENSYFSGLFYWLAAKT